MAILLPSNSFPSWAAKAASASERFSYLTKENPFDGVWMNTFSIGPNDSKLALTSSSVHERGNAPTKRHVVDALSSSVPR